MKCAYPSLDAWKTEKNKREIGRGKKSETLGPNLQNIGEIQQLIEKISMLFLGISNKNIVYKPSLVEEKMKEKEIRKHTFKISNRELECREPSQLKLTII